MKNEIVKKTKESPAMLCIKFKIILIDGWNTQLQSHLVLQSFLFHREWYAKKGFLGFFGRITEIV